jgi:signal-transduction protein with cAMP-binding, CBS, and nucleotidyltransferase domain
MNNFNEIKNEYKRFEHEFSDNIKDNFGFSIKNNGLEPIAQCLEVLYVQETKIEIETLKIQKTLLEAKAIMPDSGV